MQNAARGRRHRPAAVRSALRRAANSPGGADQPAGGDHRALHHGPAGGRRPGDRRASTPSWSGSSWPPSCSSSAPARVYVSPRTGRRSRPYGWSRAVMGAAGGRASSPTSASTPSRPPPRRRRTRSATCRSASSRRWSSARCSTSPCRRHSHRHRAGGRLRGRASAFLNAPVAFALSVIGQDWAAYLVSAGAVAGITSVLLVMLMSQPRIFFAMSRDGLLPHGRQQGAPALRHALHHHHHHLRDRGAGGRRDPDPDRRRDDQHRHAVRLCRCLRGRADATRQAAGGAPAVPRALRPGLPGARHPVVRLPDAQPAGHHLGSLPGVARHRRS